MGLREVEKADCERIRTFLHDLVTKDRWLERYIDDPVLFLNEIRDEAELTQGDLLLLLDGNYEHVQAVMTRNSAERWIVIWIV